MTGATRPGLPHCEKPYNVAGCDSHLTDDGRHKAGLIDPSPDMVDQIRTTGNCA